MKRILSSLVWLCFCLPAISAQINPPEPILSYFSSPEQIDSSNTRILFLCRSGQTPELEKARRIFLEDDTQLGYVLGYGNVLYPVSGRYRVYDDEMVIRLDGDICVLQRPAVRAVQWGERTFASLEFINKRGETDQGYFELLTDGRIRLLRRYVLRGRRRVHDCMFFQVDGEPAVRLRRARKQIRSNMTDQLQQVERFVDSGKLKWSDPADLAKIIDEYHRLRSGS